MQICSDRFGALAHDAQAQAGWFAGGHIKPNAVITGFKMNRRLREEKTHIDLCGTRVFENVVQTFLCDEINSDLHFGRQFTFTFDVQLDGQT
mgnify:FL=1